LTGEENKKEKVTDSKRHRFVDAIKSFIKRKAYPIKDAEFNEEEHPRGEGGEHGGQFVKKGSGQGAKGGENKKEDKREAEESPAKVTKKTKNFVETKRNEEGKLVNTDGSSLPEHIAHLQIAPAYTNVRYNPDPKGDLLVVSKDAGGRTQPIYCDAHWAAKEKIKYAKEKEANKKFKSIVAQNERDLNDPKKKEAATVFKLIINTSMRPGSKKDTGAAVKAYGATTLMGQHVIETKEGIELDFIGKKGKRNIFPVDDPFLVKEIKERAKKAGPDGDLFNCDGRGLRRYSRIMDGGKFNPKDFRTLIGTELAVKEMKKMKDPPKSMKEYKRMTKAVAEKVAAKLNNTPAVCLKAYINLAIFAEWKMNLEEK